MADFGPGLITVFGGSGFIGAQVVRALAKRGWRVRVAVRKPAASRDRSSEQFLLGRHLKAPGRR